MILNYGTYEVRYCVARVWLEAGEPRVTFMAYCRGYGLHEISNINDEYVLWYDTEAEAKKHLMGANSCVLSKGRDIKK